MKSFQIVTFVALLSAAAAQITPAQNFNPISITVNSAPFDIIATPITPAAPYSQAAYQCNVSGDSRYPPFASGTFPLTVSVPVGQRVRVIFANGNLGGSTTTRPGEPGVIVQQGGSPIVQQAGGASPIVQNVGSPVVQPQNMPPAAMVVQQAPTVVQQPSTPSTPAATPRATPASPVVQQPTTTPAPATPRPSTPASPVVQQPNTPASPVVQQPTTTPAPATPRPSTPASPVVQQPTTPASPVVQQPTPTPASPVVQQPTPTPAATTPRPTTPASVVQQPGSTPAAGSSVVQQPGSTPAGGSSVVQQPGSTPAAGSSVVQQGRKLLQDRVPGGPNNGLVEYITSYNANTVPGFFAGTTQFGVPYVEFTATEAARGQTATFNGALVVAQVVGGVPVYPFQINQSLSPFCQVNVNMRVA